MSIFQNPILVTLSATESFISLCTFSRKFGRSQTFYLMKNPLMNIITGETSSAYIEQDLLNFGRVESIDNDIHVPSERRPAASITGHGISDYQICWMTSKRKLLKYTAERNC